MSTILTYPILTIGEVYEDPNGCSCGDWSVDLEVSVRCTWLAVDGVAPFVTLTITYYIPAYLLDAEGCVERHLEADELEDGGTIVFAVEEQHEWIAHTDQDDVGGTEVNSDIEYEGGPPRPFMSSLEEARAVARARAEQANNEWHEWSPENWDGGRRT